MAPPALIEPHDPHSHQSPRSPATVPREFLAPVKMNSGDLHSIPPSLYLSEGKPLSFASLQKCQEEHALYSLELQKLKDRANHLRQCANKNSEIDSPVLQACALSLRTRLPLVLRQTELLIESANSNQEVHIVGKMRSSLALVRATQYLDSIQEAMDPESNEGLDEQLLFVLGGLHTESLPHDVLENLSFRVSPWIATALCFDLPLGPSVTWQNLSPNNNNNNHTQLPIRVTVEPVVEFRAHDMSSVGSARVAAARSCHVTIQSCAHEARAVWTGAGMIGEAVVRVHIRPRRVQSSAALSLDQELQVWGVDKAVPTLCIKEARA